MKKLFFASIFMLVGISSCQNETTSDDFTSKKESPSKVFSKDREVLSEDEQSAVDLINEEVYSTIVNSSSVTDRVQYCNHSPWNSPTGEGQGYAYATINGHNYYCFFSWWTDSHGETQVMVTYLGTSPRSYMGCK
ncbi:MAG TPA: hypothetical protein DIW37_16615 [Chryseobacterium sp.]|nr:hypothetical protein [Chryseobacterium sp.]